MVPALAAAGRGETQPKNFDSNGFWEGHGSSRAAESHQRCGLQPPEVAFHTLKNILKTSFGR
jgi:hypothetical protein